MSFGEVCVRVFGLLFNKVVHCLIIEF
jgi:hypothetical protein